MARWSLPIGRCSASTPVRRRTRSARAPLTANTAAASRTAVAQVLEALRVELRPRVDVASMERQNVREPGSPGQAAGSEADERVVAMDQLSAVPAVPCPPGGVRDEAVGHRPARLAGDIGVPRPQNLNFPIALRAGGEGVSAPLATEMGQRPRDRRHGRHDGEVKPGACERLGLGPEEDAAHGVAGPGIRRREPGDLGHGVLPGAVLRTAPRRWPGRPGRGARDR